MKKESFLKGKLLVTLSILSIALINMTHGVILTVLSDIARDYPNVSESMVQFLFTVTSLSMVVGMLCSEFVSKKMQAKSIFLLSMVVFTAAGVAPVVFRSYVVLLLSRVLLGASSGVVYPLSMILIYDLYTVAQERDTIVGWNGCVSSIGRIVTYSIAGLLLTLNYRYVFYIHLIGIIPFLLVLLFIPSGKQGGTEGAEKAPAAPSSKGKGKPILSWSVVIWILVSFFYMLFELCFSSNMSMLMSASSFGSSQLAAFGLSVMTAGYFSCNLIYGKLASYTKMFTVPVGAVISGIGLLAVALASTPLLVYVACFVNGFGEGIAVQGCVTRVMTAADADNRSRAISVNAALGNLGIGISPFVVTNLSKAFAEGSIPGRYYFCAVVMAVLAIAVLLYVLCCRRKNQIR